MQYDIIFVNNLIKKMVESFGYFYDDERSLKHKVICEHDPELLRPTKKKIPPISWPFVLKYLEPKMSSPHFKTWIRPLKVQMSNKKVFLVAPNNAFAYEWIKDHYWQTIRETIGKLYILPDNFRCILLTADSGILKIKLKKKRLQSSRKINK